MNIQNMPRWLAAVMLHGFGVLVGIVGITSFGLGDWRYAKRD